MKIITIGGATQDVFMDTQHVDMIQFRHKMHTDAYLLFQEGSKIEVDHLSYCSGGGATNSAASFAHLGFDVAAIFKKANDCPGQYIEHDLNNRGINLSHCITVNKDQCSGMSFIIPSPEGDSTILAYRGVNATLTQQEFPFSIINSDTPLYITSLSATSSLLLLPICKQAQQHNALVATNPGSSQLAEGAETICQSLPYIDIFICNAQEAQYLMESLVHMDRALQKMQGGVPELHPETPVLLQSLLMYEDICFNITHYFKEVSKRGPKTVVVTNGAEGVYVFHENTIYFHPSLEVKLSNTTGAGDSFGSCFVASILKGYSVTDALINGIINASSVISYENAKDGLLNWQSIEKKAEIVGKKKIKRFKI